MTLIIASVRGRIRVRNRMLRHQARLVRLAEALEAIAGVSSVSVNARNGSIVILYDASQLPPEQAEAAVDRAVDTERARRSHDAPRSTRMRVNQAAKIGMIGSLGASMALAASGEKKWHALTGGMFLACLGVHLGVHRRYLLR